MADTLNWKPDWTQAKRNLSRWWQGEGLVVSMSDARRAFQIWGPGKTAKIQCDFSVMISPAMFREFVLPHLTSQCRHLDYAMYHLESIHLYTNHR